MEQAPQQLSTAVKESRGMEQLTVVIHICDVSPCLKTCQDGTSLHVPLPPQGGLGATDSRQDRQCCNRAKNQNHHQGCEEKKERKKTK